MQIVTINELNYLVSISRPFMQEVLQIGKTKVNIIITRYNKESLKKEYELNLIDVCFENFSLDALVDLIKDTDKYKLSEHFIFLD